MVHDVVHAPHGALPTSMFPSYVHDESFYDRYARASADPAEFAEFFRTNVVEPETWQDFLAKNDLIARSRSAS